jgi:hypothetical protein
MRDAMMNALAGLPHGLTVEAHPALGGMTVVGSTRGVLL